MQFQHLTLTRTQWSATVTLNRPQVRNAFDDVCIAELTTVFAQLAREPDVRTIVLAAHGVAFCAGADLNWMKRMASYTHAENLADAQRLADMLKTIHACPQVVIAKVQGDCFAGGMGLIAACDVVVANRHTQFCLSEVKFGLIPATISPYVIAAIGQRAAQRYFVTAERFDAAEALRIGLVHQICAPEELDAVCNQLVEQCAGNSPAAVRAAKKLVRDVAGRPIDDDLIANTAQCIADARGSAEGQEGLRAFLEKRAPDWKPD